MKGYKGFDKNMKCRSMQYEFGKKFTHNGTVSLCKQGLHFCEHPLDTWNYYKPLDGSHYAEVEADDVSDKAEGDSKRAASSLTVKSEVKIPALLKAAVEFVFSKVKPSAGDSAHSATTGISAHSATTGIYAHSATTGDSAHSATTGIYAHSATTGNYAHSATTGDSAHSATTGISAHSATTGDSAHSATTGNYAHSATTGDSAHSATTGNYAHSATTGDSAHSATTGDSAHSATTGNYAESSVSGKNAIAASLGIKGKAKAAKGDWIVLAEYDKDEKIIAMSVAQVRGKLKADTFYSLKGGKFTEVKA